MTPAKPSPTGAAVDAVGDLLTALTDALRQPLTAGTVWWIPLPLLAITAAVAGLARWRRAVEHRRCTDGARLIEIAAPAHVDPRGAATLWSNLLGLLVPRHHRLLRGQPHLAFEYVLTPARTLIRIWVPGPVPPGLVEHAITAAWPGARIDVKPVPRTAATRSAAARQGWWAQRRAAVSTKGRRAGHRVAAGNVAAGGMLRLARAETLPIATLPPVTLAGGRDIAATDPIRGVLAAAGTLRRGEWVIVQIQARPVTAARLTRANRARHSRRVPGGVVLEGLLWALREVLDVFLPTTARGSRSTRSRAGETIGPVSARARLADAAADRAAVAKGRGAGYATLLRYATATPVRTRATNLAANLADRAHLAATAARHDPPPASDAESRSEPDASLDASLDATADAAVNAAWEAARARVRARAHAIAAVFAAFSDHNHYRRRHLRHPALAIRQRRFGRGDVLSVPELAALAHLPLDTHVPRLHRAAAVIVAPHPNIPSSGPGIIPLGTAPTSQATTSGGPRRTGRPVGLAVADARHHTHVLGATGSGKSVLLINQALAAIKDHRGLLFMDNKGDAISDIIDRLPAEDRQLWHDGGRLVLIDPDTPDPLPCLNPLAPHPRLTTTSGSGSGTGTGTGTGTARAGGRGGQHVGDLAVDHTVSVFARLFGHFWGPRTDDLFRVACLTLRAGRGTPTLADVAHLLVNPDRRTAALEQLQPANPIHRVLEQFWNDYEHLTDAGRAQTAAPLLNKLRALLLRGFAADVLAAGPSTLNLADVLDRGGICLVRIPKGSLGDDTSRLLGSLILAQTWQAITTRNQQHPDQRRDAALIIDEAHNFLNLPHAIDDMLAEARGYRVAITIAHQHLAQLPRELRDGISTNARNKIYFTLGADDATHLARHTLPELGAHDLAHPDAFHATARLVHAGRDLPAFTLATHPLRPAPALNSKRT